MSVETYPYEITAQIKNDVINRGKSIVDLSVGSPIDPMPDVIRVAISNIDSNESHYPSSSGSTMAIETVNEYLVENLKVECEDLEISLCIGTKEFIASSAIMMKSQFEDRNVILYPSISYPTYKKSAEFAQLEGLPVPVSRLGDIDYPSPGVLNHTLIFWFNSPANPYGSLVDVRPYCELAEKYGFYIFVDECYADYAWSREFGSALKLESDRVVVIHSISKRSNAAGVRAGFFAGKSPIVKLLKDQRRHAGLMVPHSSSRALVASYSDSEHVILQRERYLTRLTKLRDSLERLGFDARLPEGTFYLWVKCPDGVPDMNLADSGDVPSLSWVKYLAHEHGLLGSPGYFYGKDGEGYIRFALTVADDELDRALAQIV